MDLKSVLWNHWPMLIKLAIVAGVAVLGGIVFANELGMLFPHTSATVGDSLRDDVASLGSKAANSVEQRIDGSVEEITEKTSIIKDEVSQVGEKIQDRISDARQTSQEAVENINPV